MLNKARGIARRCKWLLTGKLDGYLKTDWSDNYKISIENGSRFAGKVIAVTGASGEIGKAICIKLAGEGAEVICLGRSEDRLIATTEQIANIKDNTACYYTVDISNQEIVKDVFSNIKNIYGKLDGLVNCAGESARGDAKELYLQSPDIINKIIDINLKGCLWCCKEALSIMVQQGGGKIVNISSTVGIGGKTLHTEYAAAKAGIIAVTRNLAMEYGTYGININCVSPGIVQRGELSMDLQQRICSTNYLGKICYAKDVVGTVAFLLSEDSQFITGENIVVAGGRDLGLKGD